MDETTPARETQGDLLEDSGNGVLKKCTSCLALKPITEYYNRKGGQSKDASCKVCTAAENRRRYIANRENRMAYATKRYAEIRSDPKRWLMYSVQQAARRLGLDYDVIASHFESHNGLCDICGDTNIDPGRTRLVVDHDHDQKVFRGILCSNCNRAIGLLKDNSKTALAAARYLQQNGR